MNENFLDRLYNYRSFMPWYDSSADYNTDAKSYYDYLARTNQLMNVLTDLINDLIKRKINFNDSNTIDFDKNDPINEIDDINVTADVLLAKNGINYDNAIQSQPDGLYAKDFSNDVARLFNIIDTAGNAGVDYRDIGVLGYIPLNFPGINSITTTMGQPYIYPNAFYEDDEYYYIQYMPGNFNPNEVKSNHNTFAVWNKSDMTFRSVFWAGFGGTNGLYVEKIDGKRYLYSKVDQANYNIGRFDITDMPYAGAGPVEMPLNKEYTLSHIGSEFTKYGDSWLVQQNMIPRGFDWDHTTLVAFDSEFENIKGYYRMTKASSGMVGTTYESGFKVYHSQGLAVKDNNIIHVGGGLWRAGENVTPYHANGVVVNGAGGEITEDYTFSPVVLHDYFVSKGHTVNRIELEGAVVYNNRIHSLVIYNTAGNATDAGMAVIEFGSPRRDIRGEMTYGNTEFVNHSGFASAYMGKNRENKLYDPYTGNNLEDMFSLLLYMKNTGQDEVNFYSSGVVLKDFDGSQIPAGYFVEIQNVNNRTFWFHYRTNVKRRDYSRFVTVDADFTKVTNDIPQNLTTYEGWNKLTLASGVGGSISYRRVNELIEIRFEELTVDAVQKKIGTLPDGYKPYAGEQFQMIQDRGKHTIVEVDIQTDGDIIFAQEVIGTHAPSNIYRGVSHVVAGGDINIKE